MKKIDFHIHYLPEHATEKEMLISMDKQYRIICCACMSKASSIRGLRAYWNK